MLLHRTDTKLPQTAITELHWFGNKSPRGLTIFGLMNIVTIIGILVVVALLII